MIETLTTRYYGSGYGYPYTYGNIGPEYTIFTNPNGTGRRIARSTVISMLVISSLVTFMNEPASAEDLPTGFIKPALVGEGIPNGGFWVGVVIGTGLFIVMWMASQTELVYITKAAGRFLPSE